MLQKWRKKRVLKKLQAECFHEYHIVSSYTMNVGGAFYYKAKKYNDLYCPICDKVLEEVSEIDAKRQLEIQKTRNEYKETI